jgi:hypothetical protein
VLNGRSPPLNKKANVEIIQQRHRKNKTQISFEEIKKMKHLRLKRLYGLILIGCFSILHVPIVFAVANDTISNQARLDFTVGGGPNNILLSDPGGNDVLGLASGALTTDFIEDRVVNFTVAEVGAATTLVAPSATLQVQTFTVTNNGNATMDFLLAALDAVTTTADPWGGANDSFDVVATPQVFVETVNAGFAAGDDTDIFIDELAPAGVITVYIVSTIPVVGLPLVNGDVSVMALVAQAAEGGAAAAEGAAIMNDTNDNASVAGTYSNGGTVTVAAVVAGTVDNAAAMDTVFNDPAGVLESDGTAGVIQNGQHSAYDSYTVGAALVTVTKTAAILWDPVNGAVANDPKAIPGAYMRYTITVTNDALAGASADLTTLSDTLQAGAGTLALDPDLLDGTGVPPAVGGPVILATESFDVAHSGTSTRADPVSCTSVADADGCDFADPVITIDFTLLMPIEVGPGYTAGELKPGDTVTLFFNAIVQ